MSKSYLLDYMADAREEPDAWPPDLLNIVSVIEGLDVADNLPRSCSLFSYPQDGRNCRHFNASDDEFFCVRGLSRSATTEILDGEAVSCSPASWKAEVELERCWSHLCGEENESSIADLLVDDGESKEGSMWSASKLLRDLQMRLNAVLRENAMEEVSLTDRLMLELTTQVTWNAISLAGLQNVELQNNSNWRALNHIMQNIQEKELENILWPFWNTVMVTIDNLVKTLEYRRHQAIFPYSFQLLECQICYEAKKLYRRPCCSMPICCLCLREYMQVKINDGVAQIQCCNNNCAVYIHKEEIMLHTDDEAKEKLVRFLVDANRDPTKKTCPRYVFYQQYSQHWLLKYDVFPVHSRISGNMVLLI